MNTKLFFFCLLVLSFFSCNTARKSINQSSKKTFIYGTYNNAPRLENGRVDNQKLLAQLKDLNANTYNWLVWKGEKDWDDLRLFLPLAKANNIDIWITIVPPTESKPKAKWNSEPFGVNYIKWSEEIAKLSKQYSNFTTYSIDDFAHNLNVYTPEYLGKMIAAVRAENPHLKFIPCLYYRQIKPDFAAKYAGFLDGVLFPYRAESKKANLQDAFALEQEIARIRTLFREGFPVYLDVYSTAHSALGASTPQYVKDVISEGKKFADGVLIYTHPHPADDKEKYEIVKEAFRGVR